MRKSAEAKEAIARCRAARNFPENTDPCSRHAFLIGEGMLRKNGYPMLAEEPEHCALSILYTVALLWESRNEVARLKAKYEG